MTWAPTKIKKMKKERIIIKSELTGSSVVSERASGDARFSRNNGKSKRGSHWCMRLRVKQRERKVKFEVFWSNGLGSHSCSSCYSYYLHGF